MCGRTKEGGKQPQPAKCPSSRGGCLTSSRGLLLLLLLFRVLPLFQKLWSWVAVHASRHDSRFVGNGSVRAGIAMVTLARLQNVQDHDVSSEETTQR